jgi:flagellar motor switch protein FliM
MPERQLTTREIDDILTVFKGRRRTDQPTDVASLDLNRPAPIPKGIFETLEVRHEQAARAMRNGLREVLRRDLGVSLQSLELDRFAAFKEALPEPSCSFVVEMLPLRQPGYLVLDYPFVFAVLDRVLGGTGVMEGAPRELTSTESAVLGDVLGSILNEQAQVWSRWVKLTPRILRSTSVPRYFREARADDPVLIASYALTGFAEGTTFRFALPLPGLEPHLQCAPRSEAAEAPRTTPVSKDVLLRAMADVQLDLSVRLGGAELALEDVLELAVGDVLVLDTRTDQPLQLLVQDLPRFEGQLFRRGQRLAFQLGSADSVPPNGEGTLP